MSKLLPILALFLAGCQSAPPSEALRTELQHILADKDAVVGVAIIGNEGKDTLSIHGDRHFPMQSVFKFHIALAVLGAVDKGALALDQRVEVTKEDLFPEGIWSPLRDAHPEGGSFTVAELIRYSVSQSDNTACDVLIRLLGSPAAVEQYLHDNGIREVGIVYTEEEMQAQWENMFLNWTTPKAASRTLQMFLEKDTPLSAETHAFLWQTMKETSTGMGRLRGQLPAETIVAHKTGSSGTNDATGITAAVNDIGVIYLPSGEYFIISVFVSDSREDDATNEKIIADIAKAVYDHYAGR